MAVICSTSPLSLWVCVLGWGACVEVRGYSQTCFHKNHYLFTKTGSLADFELMASLAGGWGEPQGSSCLCLP